MNIVKRTYKVDDGVDYQIVDLDSMYPNAEIAYSVGAGERIVVPHWSGALDMSLERARQLRDALTLLLTV